MKTSKPNHFQNRHYRNRAKYRDCEYVDVGSHQIVRKLTASEIDEFKAGIQRLLNPGIAVVRSLFRRSVV